MKRVLGLTVIASGLAALGLLGGWMSGALRADLLPTEEVWFRGLVRSTLLVASVAVAAVVIRGRIKLIAKGREIERESSSEQLQEDASEASNLLDFLSERAAEFELSANTISMFLQTVDYPEQARRVVTQTLRPSSRDLSVSTRIDFAVKSFASESVPVCALRIQKGELYKDLAVVDNVGQPLNALSRTDSMAFLWSVVRHLICNAYVGDGASDQGSDPTRVSMLSDLEKYFAAGIVLPRDQAPIQSKPNIQPVNTEAARALDRIFDKLIDKYPVIVIVEEGSTELVGVNRLFCLGYTYSLPLGDQPAATHSKWTSFRNRLRTSLRVSNLQLRFDIGSAKRCHDYHLRVFPPEGTTISQRLFHDANTGVISKEPEHRGKVTRYHYRTPKPFGQRFAYLYTRDFGKSDHIDPRYFIRLDEEFPGTLGRATLIAWAIAWVVWVTGLCETTGLLERASAASIVGLLLSLQGALIGWVGGEFLRSAPGLSLTARVSFLISSSLALAASILLVMRITERIRAHELPFDYNLIFLDDWMWATIEALALMHAAYLTLTLLVRRPPAIA